MSCFHLPFALMVCVQTIALIKSTLSIPVISNGNVCKPSDVTRNLRETKCDGLMIGEQLLADPSFLSRVIALDSNEARRDTNKSDVKEYDNVQETEQSDNTSHARDTSLQYLALPDALNLCIEYIDLCIQCKSQHTHVPTQLDQQPLSSASVVEYCPLACEPPLKFMLDHVKNICRPYLVEGNRLNELVRTETKNNNNNNDEKKIRNENKSDVRDAAWIRSQLFDLLREVTTNNINNMEHVTLTTKQRKSAAIANTRRQRTNEVEDVDMSAYSFME